MPTGTRPTVELFSPQTWEVEVADVVAAIVPPRAVKHLKRVRGEDMFHDTLDYLEEAYSVAGDHLSDERRADLVDAVLARFAYFRSYHGCRPLSLESYTRDGLLPLTRPRLAELAYALFEGTVARCEIDRLSEQAKLGTREGHVYFVADGRELVARCGHYLIYGAEALCCLWRDQHERALPQFRESQERHRSRGIPTIFECDVPVAWIPPEGRRDLAHTLVTQYFQLQSRRPVMPAQWSRNWGYSIHRDLPVQFLRSHVHPATIPDPLRHFVPYRNPHTRCAWCPPEAIVFEPRTVLEETS